MKCKDWRLLRRKMEWILKMKTFSSPALVLVLIQKTTREYVGTMAIRLTGSEIFETRSTFCRFPGFPRPLFFPSFTHFYSQCSRPSIKLTALFITKVNRHCFAQNSLKGGKLAGPRKRCSRQERQMVQISVSRVSVQQAALTHSRYHLPVK